MKPCAGPPVQNIHHTAAGIPHVHTALPDVIIVHIVQPGGKNPPADARHG